MTDPARIADLAAIRNFILAGNATFTLVSKATGARKTFRVRVAPQKPNLPSGWFVEHLRGPDNTRDFAYLGFLRDGGGALRFAARYPFPAARVFGWFLRRLDANDDTRFHEEVEFWHAGLCGRCGRPLTVPSSIATGIGPVCATKE